MVKPNVSYVKHSTIYKGSTELNTVKHSTDHKEARNQVQWSTVLTTYNTKIS